MTPLLRSLLLSLLLLACGRSASSDQKAPRGERCGGAAAVICDTGLQCADIPYDACVMGKDSSCNGVCVNGSEAPCGGLVGKTCPGGVQCVDDPRDDCQPEADPDCAGLCAPKTA